MLEIVFVFRILLHAELKFVTRFNHKMNVVLKSPNFRRNFADLFYFSDIRHDSAFVHFAGVVCWSESPGAGNMYHAVLSTARLK